jgi:dienelactone hydrolase
VTDPERYRSTLEHLATWGYVVMATESSLGLFPGHAAYAEELSLCLTYLDTANADAGSPLFGQVDALHHGMSGHSMGGGASMLATAADPRVRALATLAANETNPSAVSAMASVSVPVCLLTGDSDGITNWQQNSLAMYDNTLAPRQLPLILGGYHCGFLDSSILFCDSGSISRAEQLAITRRTVTAFFQLYLKGDQEAWTLVWGPAADLDPDVDASRLDAGVRLSPDSVSIGGFEDEAVEAELVLENTGPAATSYTLLQEGAAWPTVLTPEQTGVLQPEQSTVVTVAVTVPAGGIGLQDSVLVSARSELDGGTRGFATVDTRGLLRGDCDGDEDVDEDDYIAFEACLAGPRTDAPPECACFDLDGSGSITARDFGVLQLNYGGG